MIMSINKIGINKCVTKMDTYMNKIVRLYVPFYVCLSFGFRVNHHNYVKFLLWL